MVSIDLVQGILKLTGLACASTVYLGLWVWRYTNNTDRNDERVEELRNEEKSELHAELAEDFLVIEEYVTESEDPPEEVTREEHVVNVLEREFDESILESTTRKLEKVGESKELWIEHYEAYERSYIYSGYAAACFLIFGALIISGAMVNEAPNRFLWKCLYAGAGLSSAFYLYHSLNEFKRAKSRKDAFNEKWDEYKDSDKFC